MIIKINDNRDKKEIYIDLYYSRFSSIVCEVNTTVFFFNKYHTCLKCK